MIDVRIGGVDTYCYYGKRYTILFQGVGLRVAQLGDIQSRLLLHVVVRTMPVMKSL